VKCLTCEHISEVNRPLAMFPATPVCPDCGAETEQIHLPSHLRWTPEPVVVYKAPDGTFRFPGDPNGVSAKGYDKQGFERVEIRGAVEMRRFENRMNKRDYAEAQRRFEHKQEQREAREKISRGELHRQMQNMSAFGRAVAQVAMARGDAKKPRRAAEPGFYSEAYSMDRSNRQESRDEQGRRRRD
jgi:hypothetical protein